MPGWERKLVKLAGVSKSLVYRAQEIDKMENQMALLEEGHRVQIRFLIDDLRRLFSKEALKEAGIE